MGSVFRLLQGFEGLGFELPDAFRRGQFFGHGAAEFLDGLADFVSDFAVGFVRLVFAGDLFATQFVLRLGGAEEIGGKLGAAHVVEDLLALFQSLAAVDVLRTQSTVEAHVAVVLENGVIAGLDDTSPFRRIGKLAVVGAEIGSDREAALFLQFLIAQLLPPGLDGKVCLSLCDDLLCRIGVLDDEVAGVAGHHHGLERALGTAADLDHLVGADEMVFNPLSAVDTGCFCLRDDCFKVTVIHVAEDFGEVPARPEFVARRICAADGLERRDLVVHDGLKLFP